MDAYGTHGDAVGWHFHGEGNTPIFEGDSVIMPDGQVLITGFSDDNYGCGWSFYPKGDDIPLFVSYCSEWGEIKTFTGTPTWWQMRRLQAVLT